MRRSKPPRLWETFRGQIEFAEYLSPGRAASYKGSRRLLQKCPLADLRQGPTCASTRAEEAAEAPEGHPVPVREPQRARKTDTEQFRTVGSAIAASSRGLCCGRRDLRFLEAVDSCSFRFWYLYEGSVLLI